MDNNNDALKNSSFDDATKVVIARIQNRQIASASQVNNDVPENNDVPAVIESVIVLGPAMAFWPEDTSAMPTQLTRVAFFGLPADNPSGRETLSGFKLDSRCDVEVIFSGEELGAKEETTWLACLRINRGIRIGQRIYLNLSDFLHEMRLSNTGGKRGNRLAVSKRLDRLALTKFKITYKVKGKSESFTTGLLNWGHQHETGRIYIELDPSSTPLYKNLAYQPWEVRLSLKSDVAARMLTYISGHQQGKPHSIKLDDLRRWCGYKGRLRDFRSACVAALSVLEEKGVLVKESSKIFEGANGEVAFWQRTKTSPSGPSVASDASPPEIEPDQ